MSKLKLGEVSHFFVGHLKDQGGVVNLKNVLHLFGVINGIGYPMCRRALNGPEGNGYRIMEAEPGTEATCSHCLRRRNEGLQPFRLEK